MAESTLVCLHGLGRSAADWDGVRRGLGRFGHVVTPQLPRAVAGAQRIATAAAPPGSILIGHSLGSVIAMRMAAESAGAVRGVILSSPFFPPALNGRSLPVAIADYARHRMAFVRGLSAADRPPGSGRGAGRGLGFMVRTATRGASFRVMTAAIASPVLVLHARDDHYVPLDFVLAAVATHPAWQLAVLPRGGHYPHLTDSKPWLASVEPWLERLVSTT